MAATCTCYNGCSTCGASCGSGCQGTCTNACSGCTSQCTNSCHNNCQGSCQGGCSKECSSTCKGSCSGKCSRSCQNSCSGTEEGNGDETTTTITGYIAKYDNSINENQIGAWIWGLSSDSPAGVIEWYIDGKWYAEMALPAKSTQSNVQEFKKLDPGTSYSVSAEINYNDSGSGTLKAITIRTSGAPSTGNFVWTYSGYNDSGKLIHGNEKMQGFGFYISPDEWKALVNNVRNKLQARNISTVNYPMNDTMSVGSDFKALYFNQVRKAISAFASFDDTPEIKIDKKAGDKITAEHLNSLMDHVNRVN